MNIAGMKIPFEYQDNSFISKMQRQTVKNIIQEEDYFGYDMNISVHSRRKEEYDKLVEKLHRNKYKFKGTKTRDIIRIHKLLSGI